MNIVPKFFTSENQPVSPEADARDWPDECDAWRWELGPGADPSEVEDDEPFGPGDEDRAWLLRRRASSLRSPSCPTFSPVFAEFLAYGNVHS